ncbi:MAG: tetratricopeptide repeat protein [Candidatus Aminicenantes bacterium]|nr:tetratricopeptide repeat protein [Candidatus Aminicenantes bacterium]
MNSKKTLILLAFIAAILMAFGFQNSSEHKVLFEKAKFTMETKGDLKGAIKLFSEIIKKYPDEREYAAKSQLYIGLCYEKLGLREAQKAFQKVVDNYPDQRQEVAVAKEKLASMAKELEKVPHMPTFRKLRVPTKLSWIMQLSPDGKKVIFASPSDKKLWMMSLSGKLGSEFPGAPSIVNTGDVEVDWSGLAWSGDGKWIVFNDWIKPKKFKEKEGKHGMYIVSAEGGKPRKVYENYRDVRIVNYRMSLSPDGKILAFSSVDNKECHIHTISVDGGLPKQLVEAQAREPVFSPDGKMIAYVDTKNLGRAGGGLWVIPASGGAPKLVANAGNASSPTWSPDGDMIAFLDLKSQQICTIPVGEDGAASGELVKIDIPEGTGGIMSLAGWTPDNKIAAVFRSHTEFGLYTLPSTGGKAALVSHGGYPGQPRWSPDGKRIFHTNELDEGSGDWERLSLAVVPAEGGKVKTIPIEFDEKMIKPSWGGGNDVSPDGKTIVFAGKSKKDTGWHWQIWTLPVDGGKPKQLTQAASSFNNGFPRWSPDGKTIAYVRAILDKVYSTGFREVNICTIPADGGEPKALTSDSDRAKFGPIAWSPDGKWIAYYSFPDEDPFKAGILKILSVSDGVSRVVGKLELAHVHIELAWSPDSKRIAYIYGTESYGKSIRVASIDDGSTEDVETGLVDKGLFHLDWSSDGDSFVFSGYEGDSPELWLMEDFLPKEKTQKK